MTDQTPANDRDALSELLALSAELARLAADPAQAGTWIGAFLGKLVAQYSPAMVQGAQLIQLVGNMAITFGTGGKVPGDPAPQSTATPDPLVLAVFQSRTISGGLTQRAYPIMSGMDPVAALVLYFGGARPRDDQGVFDNSISVLTLQLGPLIAPPNKVTGSRTARLTDQIEMMRNLYEATRTVNTTLATPEEGVDLFAKAARSMVEALRVDHAEIAVIDHRRHTVKVVAESPDTGQTNHESPLHGNPVLERFGTDLTPIAIPRADSPEAFTPEQKSLRDSLQQAKVRSALILPLVAEDLLLGTVGIHTYDTYREFRPEEIEAARGIASQLAISARNTQLYEDIKHRADQLERIADLSGRMMSTFNRNAIFQIIKDEVPRLVDADVVCVALRSADDKQLNVFVLGDGEPALNELSVEQTALHPIIRAGEPVILEDITGAQSADYKLFALLRMASGIAIPLVVGRKNTGAFLVLHRRAGYYTRSDVAVAEQVGTQLAIALENARQYTQTAERANTEELVNQLNTGIPVASDMQDLLLNTTRQIAVALGAHKARIRLQLPTSSGPVPIDTATIQSISNKLSGKREN